MRPFDKTPYEGHPLSEMSPPQIDQIWFPLMGEIDRERGRLASYLDYQRRAAAGDRGYYGDYSKQIEEHRARLADAKDAEKPFTAEYESRGGWSRYPLVIGPNGHFHQNTNCSTCFPDTQFGLVWEVSGMTPEELVERVGFQACSVCWEWAPSHPAWERSIREDKETKNARRDEKKRLAREKLEKKIMNANKRRERAVAKLAALGIDPSTPRSELAQRDDDSYFLASDIEREDENLRYARADLQRWDEKNPGFSPAEKDASTPAAGVAKEREVYEL